MIRSQRGQAIVVIAIMLGALVGMVALAVDGSRAYTLRRDLQDAVDAAALAAGDNLQQTQSYSSAEQAATTSFSTNLFLYNAPVCAPGYGSPGAAPFTVTCTYSDGTVLTQVVSALGAAGSQFTLTGRRDLNLMFGRILTNGATPRLTAIATGNVDNHLWAPTLAALSQAGCGGAGGSAITITGGNTLNVLGDIVSAGSISVAAGSNVRVAGDIYARCQASVSNATTVCYPSGASTPCTFPDVAGTTKTGSHFADPNYPLPVVLGGSQPSPGVDVVLSPGTYAVDPTFNTGVCWFLSPGVYNWQGGYTADGDLVSNELRPPDEPVVGNNTVVMNPQFWDTNNEECSGDFRVSGIGAGLPIATGTWPVELTSVRTDTYLGVNYIRESAPSMCRTVSITAGQVMQVEVSNVPGATSYNIYVGKPNTGCGASLGFAGNLPVVGRVRNDGKSAKCPSFTPGKCSLGTEKTTLNSVFLPILPIPFAPNPLASPGVTGAYPPSSETAPLAAGLPNQGPDRSVPNAGDRANENQCATAVGVRTSCPAAITPGAVEFYIPNGGCLSTSGNGDNYIFSGYQYDWLVVYEPGAGHAPANTCSNTLDAKADSAFIGLIYMPAAAFESPEPIFWLSEATGGVIADTFLFDDLLPTINYSSDFAPVPPAARLVS